MRPEHAFISSTYTWHAPCISCCRNMTMRNLIRALVLLSAPLLTFGGSKIAPDLPQSDPNATVDVIVQYKTAPSTDELKQLGPYGQIKKIYSVINGVNIALTVKAIQQITADPNVLYVTPNRTS